LEKISVKEILRRRFCPVDQIGLPPHPPACRSECGSVTGESLVVQVCNTGSLSGAAAGDFSADRNDSK
jgi:hypothetical protein